jgi:hypothetical protein
VFDLDESETTDTLDAPLEGVSYSLPFDRIAAIVPPGHGDPGDQLGGVTLHDGGALRLERAGDLGDGNAGLLVFGGGTAKPEYLSWREVARVELDRPPASHRP